MIETPVKLDETRGEARQMAASAMAFATEYISLTSEELDSSLWSVASGGVPVVPLCVVRDANMGHQLAGSNSS